MSSNSRHSLLRAIPKVDACLGWLADESAPAYLVKKAVRAVLDERRRAVMAGEAAVDLSREQLESDMRRRLAGFLRPNFRTVVNATGVVVHTNMGRSPLPARTVEGLTRVGRRYSNLEFDLATGKRGSRYSLVEGLLCELTGAEAALVVNNNAAAVFLALSTVAAGREVIVSRGQLVEIGGSFRIPDVMARSGAILVEVGATNRTHRHDYERAITENTALLLKVHTSNFRVIGFTSEVSLPELCALGRARGIPVMEDLGSGCFVDLSRFGLPREPTVREVVAGGVDIVTFSGDKLLGGPQAGIILGRREIIGRIKKNPLNRALRIDKFTLAGLESILRLYYDEDAALREIPTLAMLSVPFSVLERRARRLVRLIKKNLAPVCDVRGVTVSSRVGGGALPEYGLPTKAVALRPFDVSVNALESGLRRADPPVIGRIEDGALLLDMRTVADDEIKPLAGSLTAFFHGGGA